MQFTTNNAVLILTALYLLFLVSVLTPNNNLGSKLLFKMLPISLSFLLTLIAFKVIV